MARTTTMRRRGPTSPGGDNGRASPTRRQGGPMGWYMGLLTIYPIRTKSITAGVLNLIGDVFSQMIVEKSKSLNLRRAASFTFLGLALVGPALHYWYTFMNRVVKAQGVKGVGIRLVMDQFFFAPCFIAVIFSSLLIMEGRPNEIQSKLQKDWKPTLIANWKLWIPFQFCNFMFVPPMLQVLFCNIVSLVWNVYISYAGHSSSSRAGSMKHVQQNVPAQHNVPHEAQVR